MKKITLLFPLAAFLMFTTSLRAQSRQGNWCASPELFEEALKSDKAFANDPTISNAIHTLAIAP